MNEPAAPQPRPHVWSPEALYAKAELYTQRMLEEDRAGWEFCLWSTFALEFLARGAITTIHPTLNASSKDAANLLFAAGVLPSVQKFTPKSADISTVVDLLSKCGTSFTSEHRDFAIVHLERRNEELHSGSTRMASEKNSEWLPKYYGATEALLTFFGKTLDDYIGDEEAATAEQLIQAMKDDSAKSVAQSIAHSKEGWTTKTDAERNTLVAQARVWATKTSGHRQSCPACGSTGLLHGSPSGPASQLLEEDEIVEKQPMLPTRFECVACGLKISGLARLSACGLGDVFTSTTRFTAGEYFGELNDPYEGYEPDHNEDWGF